MEISVELTLSPLQEDFEKPITAFIKRLRASEFKLIENPLSTQIYGEYDALMSFLTKEVKEVFSLLEHGVLFMKIVSSDRSDYEPNF